MSVLSSRLNSPRNYRFEAFEYLSNLGALRRAAPRRAALLTSRLISAITVFARNGSFLTLAPRGSYAFVFVFSFFFFLKVHNS